MLSDVLSGVDPLTQMLGALALCALFPRPAAALFFCLSVFHALAEEWVFALFALFAALFLDHVWRWTVFWRRVTDGYPTPSISIRMEVRQ